METQLLPVSEETVALAASRLKAGGIVGIPTETVYGLAASALDNRAVRSIFKAKGRPQDNPLIVHIASVDALPQVVREVPEEARLLAEAFWPGPLTMVLPRGGAVADAVCAGLDTVAVRMPKHPAALCVIEESGLPLAAPSANSSGRPSPTTAAHVFEDMQGRIPLILDGGPCEVGVESTVLSLAEGPCILRPGLVKPEQLEVVLGKAVALAPSVLREVQAGEAVQSPGMKYKHYAPRAEVVLVHGTLSSFAHFAAQHKEPGSFALCFEGEQASIGLPSVTYGNENDEETQASALFAALRRLDKLGAERVYARVADNKGAGLAVYNRLLRAAAFRELFL